MRSSLYNQFDTIGCIVVDSGCYVCVGLGKRSAFLLTTINWHGLLRVSELSQIGNIQFILLSELITMEFNLRVWFRFFGLINCKHPAWRNIFSIALTDSVDIRRRWQAAALSKYVCNLLKKLSQASANISLSQHTPFSH